MLSTDVLAKWWERWGVITVISILCYAAITRLIWHGVLEPSFAHLESQEATSDIDRCTAALQREIDSVARTTTDYATWDECHDFASGTNPRFIEKNFAWSHLGAAMGMHLFRISDTDGKVLASEASPYLPAINRAGWLDALPLARLTALVPLGPPPHSDTVAGIVRGPADPLIIAAAAIRRNSGEGDSVGHMILGRILDATLVSKISQRAHVPFGLIAFSDPPPAGQATPETDRITLTRRDAENLRAEIVIPGLTEAAALRLSATLPRAVMARGRHAMHIIDAITAIATVLIAFLFGRQGQRAHQLRLRTDQLVDSWHKLDDENRQRMQELSRRIEAEGDLRRLREQLDAVLKAIPLPLFAKDTGGRYILFNPAFEAFFGVRGENLIGRTADECWPSAHARIYHEHDMKLLREGGLQIYEHRLQDASGRDRDVIFNKACFSNLDGRIAGLVGTLTDVTAVKEAESNRRALERQVQEAHKMESLGLLAGGIAHDFNNLLIAILGRADLALLRMPSHDPGREDLNAIVTASHRAADLCRQMLTYSGRGRFVPEHFDVNAMIRELIGLLRVSISEKIDIGLDLEPDAPCITADATQIRQVIMNLVTNAAEAIGDRSGNIRIRTWIGAPLQQGGPGPTGGPRAVPTSAASVHIEIADTGCGMAPETLGRIFDPFFTTKFTGRGLGLAAAMGVVRAHAGTLSVDSQPGKGSTFHLALPAAAPQSKAPPPPLPRPPETIDPGPWKGSGTLLLVDDEDSVRTVAARMCEHLGFSVIAAQDGPQAIRMLKEADGNISCVLLDLIMPGMDGIQTLAALHAINPAIPVVLSSGYTQDEVKRRFGEAGFRAFIEKPYQLAQLRETLRTAIETGRPR